MVPVSPSSELLNIAVLARKQLNDEFACLTKVPLNIRHVVDTCGVYALYYGGNEPLYNLLLAAPLHETPIYVGVTMGSLHQRIQDHELSLKNAGFEVSKFQCRILPTPIDLAKSAEDMLLGQYKPIWNTVLRGFGLHNPGVGRQAGKTSAWDRLHPGRPWVTTSRDELEINRLQELVMIYLQERCAAMNTLYASP